MSLSTDATRAIGYRSKCAWGSSTHFWNARL
jgi:hypothetical protein